MKKMFFSAVAFAVVAVSAVAVAPTTSEAIPAFARQTGAACLSCHFQSFPALTAFGRSFKQSAFADMGEQALIEDESLSIPAVLNATVVFRPQIQSVSSTAAGVATVKSISYGDQVVLIGGRIGANAGAFIELGGGLFGNHQLITSFDVGGVKAGVSYYNTGFGENVGMQLQNSWGQHGGMMGARDVSANQNIYTFNALSAALGKQIAGLTAHVITDMGTIQAGLIAPSDGTNWGVANNTTWTAAKLVRADAFVEASGLNLGFGAMWVGGNVGDATNAYGTLAGGAAQLEMARWGIDAQVEGEIGETSFGLYADYASAGTSDGVKTNYYNTSLVDTLSGWSIRGTLKPLHNVVVAAGYGQGKAGVRKSTIYNVGAEFEIYQNFVVALTYTSNKASINGPAYVNGIAAGTTTNTTLLDIEALM